MSQENNTNEFDSLKIKEIFSICLSKWKWIALSVAIALAIATILILRAEPVYTRSAALLIKEDAKGNRSFTSELSSYASMGLFNSRMNVSNELASIQSPTLAMEVVRRLHLDIDYTRKGHFHDVTLYGTTLPVKVTPVGIPDQRSFSFLLKTGNGDKVRLSDFAQGGTKFKGQVAEGAFGDSIMTPVGCILVEKSHAFGDNGQYEITVRRNGLNASIRRCLGRLAAGINDKSTTIINLSYRDVSTQRAEDVLNTFISVYNEDWVKDKNMIAASTSEFINERLSIIERELGSVDSDISSYKSEHLIPDVDAASRMYMSQANEANAQILELSNNLAMARYIQTMVTNEASPNQLLPANSGINSATIERQISEYNAKLLQRNSLVENSSTENPLVMDMDKQLAAMRGAIVTSIDNQINSLNTQIRAFRSSAQQSTARIASNPTQAKYLLSVERQQKVKEALYLFLLQKREENELSQAFTAYNTRVVTHPSGSLSPSSPQKGKIYLAALLLGLMLPIGIIILKEYFNTKVRGRKDIEHLQIPFLGEIPLDTSGEKRGLVPSFLKRGDIPHKGILVVKGKRDVMNEAFRVLRTNLEFMTGKDASGTTIAITSFNPGSGKSFITVNLGMSLAIKERRVLMIDGDMRHGSLSALFNSPEFGLADYLQGSKDDIGGLIVSHDKDPNLHILPVGTIPPNPAELIDSERFNTLLGTLRNSYDYILIDCPPVELVADTQLIEKQTDRTIFIIRAGLLEREMLGDLANIYEEKRFKNLCTILNGTVASGGKYGNYRYGYHYGYGKGDYYSHSKG